MRKVRRFQAKDVSRAAKGGFGATLAVALLVGGLASFIAPAVASATTLPGPSAGAVQYSVTPAAISFPLTAVGSSPDRAGDDHGRELRLGPVHEPRSGRLAAPGTASPDPTDFTPAAQDNAPVAFGPFSCTENVTFTPTQPGSQTAYAVFTDTSGDNVNVPITAVASGPILTATPGAVNFGNVIAGTTATQNVVIKNIGSGPADITDASVLTGADTNFAIVSDGCNGATLAPGASCTVEVSFDNATPGGGVENQVLQVNPGTLTGPRMHLR